MKNVLPAIKIVEWIAASGCSYETPGALSEGIVLDVVYGTFTALDIEGLASLSSTSDKQSGQDVYTTTLTFKVAEQIGLTALLLSMLSHIPTCYRLTDVYGQQYLLGTPEKPYTLLTRKYTNDSTPTGARIFDVEIKYVNLFSALAIA